MASTDDGFERTARLTRFPKGSASPGHAMNTACKKLCPVRGHSAQGMPSPSEKQLRRSQAWTPYRWELRRRMLRSDVWAQSVTLRRRREKRRSMGAQGASDMRRRGHQGGRFHSSPQSYTFRTHCCRRADQPLNPGVSLWDTARSGRLHSSSRRVGDTFTRALFRFAKERLHSCRHPRVSELRHRAP